jgi:hypothetical protein
MWCSSLSSSPLNLLAIGLDSSTSGKFSPFNISQAMKAVSVHSDVNEVPVCMELCDWSEPMKCIWHHVREGFNGPLQLQVVGVEHCIELPFLRHVARIPEGSEPPGQWFRCLDFREVFSLRHLPSDEGNENQQPTEVKLVALVLRFMTILLQLVDEVAHPVHLHSFNAFSSEVDDEPRDLRWSILPNELACYQLIS